MAARERLVIEVDERLAHGKSLIALGWHQIDERLARGKSLIAEGWHEIDIATALLETLREESEEFVEYCQGRML